MLFGLPDKELSQPEFPATSSLCSRHPAVKSGRMPEMIATHSSIKRTHKKYGDYKEQRGITDVCSYHEYRASVVDDMAQQKAHSL